MPKPRVALVHDFLLDLRGAERVFLELCSIWPDADIFTAVYDERGTEGRFASRTVNASFLQGLRPTARTFRALLPFYPAAIESLDLSGYDLVVSSSSAWAHAVLCGERAVMSATATTRSAMRGTTVTRRWRAAARCHGRHCEGCSGAGGSGIGSRPSGPTATSRTRRSPSSGFVPTTVVRRVSCTRRFRSSGSRRDPSAGTMRWSPS